MSATFNSIPLTVCTKDMSERIGGLISWKDILETAPRSWASLTYDTFEQLPGYFGSRRVEPGVLWWPTSAQNWATAHFIVHQTDAAKLLSLLGQSGILQMTWEEQKPGPDGTLLYTDLPEHFPVTRIVDKIQATMILLSLRPLNIGEGGETFLATFVDQRFFWWAANTGSMTVTPGTTTWQNLYTYLGGKLGVTILYDGISSVYQEPSTLVNLQYEPIPQWLDTIAQNIGQRIICELDGTVRARSPDTDTPPELPPNVDTVAGGEYDGYVLAGTEILRPSSYDICFPIFTSGSFTGTFYVVNVTTSGTGGKATFKVAYQALSGGVSATPINSSQVTAYANQLAEDLFGWTNQYIDLVIPGIQNVTISGLHGNVRWVYTRDELVTRIQYAPYDWREWPLPAVPGPSNLTYVFNNRVEEANRYPVAIPVTPTIPSPNLDGGSCTEVCAYGSMAPIETSTGTSCTEVCAHADLPFLSTYIAKVTAAVGAGGGGGGNVPGTGTVQVYKMVAGTLTGTGQDLPVNNVGPAIPVGQWVNVGIEPFSGLLFATPFWSFGALATGTISALSGTTPGSGPATLVGITSGSLVSLSTTATIYNLSTSTIASGSYVPVVADPASGLLICASAVSGVTGTGSQYQTTVWGASNTLAGVGTGTTGQVLTSNGSGANPSYQNAGGGGGQSSTPTVLTANLTTSPQSVFNGIQINSSLTAYSTNSSATLHFTWSGSDAYGNTWTQTTAFVLASGSSILIGTTSTSVFSSPNTYYIIPGTVTLGSAFLSTGTGVIKFAYW